LKKKIIDFIIYSIKEKINILESESDSIRKEKNNITKSSAGDKFETSRSSMQIEYDKLNNQINILYNQLKLIESIDNLTKKSRVGVGSLVKTDKSFYFICIGLGNYTIDKKTIYVISLASPIGKILNNKKEGDMIIFNNREEKIETII
jgi:transcription elongation GreA/GreB family factor|tara:strand:+ start:357 stop:800 length:444 start_codon:yes stop_codon:yes gene_type:complete